MDYAAIYPETLALVKRYPAEQRYYLLEAMVQYAVDGTLPDWPEDAIEWYGWEALKQQVDRARSKSERNQANGSKAKRDEANRSESKRTEAKASEPERTEAKMPKEKENEKENDIKENNLTVVKEKRQRFSPPTADEVKAYCQERGNHVDAQRFVDFYASKGWRVGNNPMKDWKAAVRTWEQRDNITPLNTGQTYTQCQYSEADLEARITEL